MTELREVIEGQQVQGEDEEIIYTLTTTPWGSTPTLASMVVKDVTGGGSQDVTDSTTSGSISTNGDVLTLKTIKSLTAGNIYRVEVKFTAGGSIFEAYFTIAAET